MDAKGNKDKRIGGNTTRFHLQVKKKEGENPQIAKVLGATLISQMHGVRGERAEVKVRLVKV